MTGTSVVETLTASQAVTSAQAAALQRASAVAGEVLIWAIYNRPSDYPTLFIARPYGGRSGHPFRVHLEAPNLAGLRAMLPVVLIRQPRDQRDDACIVETWI